VDKKWRNRLILITVSALAGGLFYAYVIPWLTNTTASWNNNELLAVITSLAALIALSVPFINYLLQVRLAKKNKNLYIKLIFK